MNAVRGLVFATKSRVFFLPVRAAFGWMVL
jgi:hypothetical protein